MFVVDWSSANNDIEIFVHRTGSAGVLDAPLERDNCSVPPFLSNGGRPTNLRLPPPICPVVASDTSSAKPKFVTFESLPPGQYEIVVLNRGPGNETIRSGFFEN
jgi:hypothetical protein